MNVTCPATLADAEDYGTGMAGLMRAGGLNFTHIEDGAS